jgi:hypothetical protein
MHKTLISISISVLLFSCGSGDYGGGSEQGKPAAPAPATQKAATQKAASAPGAQVVDLENKFCPVMKVLKGKEEEAKADVFVVHDGKKVRFCCKECIPTFQKDPAKYMAVLPKPKGK